MFVSVDTYPDYLQLVSFSICAQKKRKKRYVPRLVWQIKVSPSGFFVFRLSFFLQLGVELFLHPLRIRKELPSMRFGEVNSIKVHNILVCHAQKFVSIWRSINWHYQALVDHEESNIILVNRRLTKISKYNTPMVWDANIVSIGNIGNIKNMTVYKLTRKEYSPS